MDDRLFNAILSMDSYNRGYGASIALPAVVDTTKLGDATITGVIADDDTEAQNIGFYAIAYSYDGGTIISFRGTDDFYGDLPCRHPRVPAQAGMVGGDPW